ncbi:hypothetical protein MRX96_047670 [Rhipicephalus microplus]
MCSASAPLVAFRMSQATNGTNTRAQAVLCASPRVTHRQDPTHQPPVGLAASPAFRIGQQARCLPENNKPLRGSAGCKQQERGARADGAAPDRSDKARRAEAGMETAQPSPQFKRPAARFAGQPVMVSEWCWHTSRGGQQRLSRQWRLSPPFPSASQTRSVSTYPQAHAHGAPERQGSVVHSTTLCRLGRLPERQRR